MGVCIFGHIHQCLLFLAHSVACLILITIQNKYADKNKVYILGFHLQKLNIYSSSEGSTIDITSLGEEKADVDSEEALEPKACFAEGMERTFWCINSH